MEHGRERLKDNALLGVLEAEALGAVLVLALERLDLDVVPERLLKALEALDVQLDVFRAGSWLSAPPRRPDHT